MDITKMLTRENTTKKVQPKESSSAPKEKVEEKKSFESLLKETKEVTTNPEQNKTSNDKVLNESEESDISKLVEELTPENKEILNKIMDMLQNDEDISLDEIGLENLQAVDGEKTEGNDLIEILVLLLALMQGNLEKKTIETLDKNEGIKAISDLMKNQSLGELVEEAKTLKTDGEGSKQNLNDILAKLVSELKETPKEEVPDKLLNLLKELTKGENKEVNTLVKDIKSELKEMVKVESVEVETVKVEIPKTEVKGDSLKGDKENLQSDKEEKFLKSLTGEEEKNSKPFSINNFKTSFGRVEQVKEAPVITKNNAVFDMIKTVKYMNTNALKELTVKIYPKELGEITISISQDKDVMKANIKANSKDAYHLLSNSLNDIKKSLGEQNIKIQEVNIGLYNDDTTFHREGQENKNSLYGEDAKKQGNGNSDSLGEEIEEITREEVYKGNVNMLA